MMMWSDLDSPEVLLNWVKSQRMGAEALGPVIQSSKISTDFGKAWFHRALRTGVFRPVQGSLPTHSVFQEPVRVKP